MHRIRHVARIHHFFPWDRCTAGTHVLSRHTGTRMAQPDVRNHLDWDEPIGLLLWLILHYVLDEEKLAEIAYALYRALQAAAGGRRP
jgi:hypothetical protein